MSDAIRPEFYLRNRIASITIKLMGAWGYQSLENDAGLDEVALLLKKSRLAVHVRKSLQQDIYENCDEIRATAYFFLVLAKNGLWEHESKAELAFLAISRLEAMFREEVYESVSFLGEIRHLINQLREVEPKPTRNVDPSPCEP